MHAAINLDEPDSTPKHATQPFETKFSINQPNQLLL